MLYQVLRFYPLSVLLLVPWLAWSQPSDWQAGIAKVSMRADPPMVPGTAFVVALEAGTAYLVTSAHVVEGDASPQIEFAAAPRKKPYASKVQHPQGRDSYGLHGLAILEVENPPSGLRVLLPSVPRPARGQAVSVAGYPAPIGEFIVTDTTVGGLRGGDLVLNYETGPGYSGGPVVRDGFVVGLVFGTEGRFGLAVPVGDIQKYLQGYSVAWGLKDDPPVAVPPRPKVGDSKVNPKDGLTYKHIPAGTFRMGCSPEDSECYDDEKPVREVTLTRGFWMGETEVTQAAYERVMGSNPSHFKGADLPVEQVSWNDAKKYCEAIRGRLPTEAEWEYAARAGTTGAPHGALNRVAWYEGNSGSKTHAVKQKEANAWGLYDMLGNVWEWVSDWYGEEYYSGGETTDPQGPPNGQRRALRGGSWSSFPRDARVSDRGRSEPSVRDDVSGFRCVGE